MNNTHSNKEDYTPSNKVISRKTKTKRESRSFKQKGGAFVDDFNGLDITGSNYCWLAASIQLLWSIKPLRDFLLTSNLRDIIMNKNINTKDYDERIFYEALDFYENNNNNNKSEPDIFPIIDESNASFKHKHSKNFKDIILALSMVFQLYQENVNTKAAAAIQISNEVLFKSDDGSNKKVIDILEFAGQQPDIDKAQEKQRDSEEFLAYIFNLFGMSNNNELMKTISYYSKTYHTPIKQDRISTFNGYLDYVKSYKYKIIEHDKNTANINKSSAEDIASMISRAEKLINEKEIDEIVAQVNNLTKENEDTPVTRNKAIIQDIQTKIFKSITGNTDPKILEGLIVNKKSEPNAMEVSIGLLLKNNNSMNSNIRAKLNNLLQLVMKKKAILTLLEKYNDISLLTRKYQFDINIVLLVKTDTQDKEHTMQQLVTSYQKTSSITVPIESKYILIKRSDETIMKQEITAHRNINIGNISYKLCGCISYTGNKTSGHYFYIAFQEGDSFLELNDSTKSVVSKTDANYDNNLKEIKNKASLYLYEKEEVLVNATEEDLAASTLVLVATAILTEPELKAKAEAKKLAREAEKKKKEKLDNDIKAAIEAENRAQEEATKIQPIQIQQQEQEQEQEAADRNRLAAGRIRRPAPTGTGDIDEDRAGDNVPPTDPYRYAESSDYGSSAENIVLGTLLCITIIISTVMLSK